MSVLALALKRLALSQGTVPKECPNGILANETARDAVSCPNGTFLKAVPTGHARDSGTNGTVGTLGTNGTLGTHWADDAIEERAGLAADRVPPVYLDAWARLNCQKPASVSEAEWRLALDDGGRFLDAWGSEAAEAGWTPGQLFDVTAGLVWRLAGERVEAIGGDHVQLSDGRAIVRGLPAGAGAVRLSKRG
jgi:hypothetical protein